jgi:diguanylate cyclase (GGDEF)-like protein/putative nucleotidyltransferase with HDIG domain
VKRSNLYVALVAGSVLAVAWDTATHSFDGNGIRLVYYLVLALLATALNRTFSGAYASKSAGLFLVLVGIAQLRLVETLFIGLCCASLESFWRKDPAPSAPQTALNLSLTALAISFCYYTESWVERISDHNQFLALVAVILVYLLCITAPDAALRWHSKGGRLLKILEECYFHAFPDYLVGVALAGAMGISLRRPEWQPSLLVLPIAYLFYFCYREFMAGLEGKSKHVTEIAALHLRTIEALALAIDAKDQGTQEHLQRVRAYSVALGKALGLGEDELEALRAASLLHDIGKLAVPEHIINKAGRLTPEEFEKMKIHPRVGAEILRQVKFPYPVVPIVEAHHEHWDGSGYPFGKIGEEIPVGARIFTVVDCLEALTSERQYRRALPVSEALEQICALSGTQFDPKVVESLKANWPMLQELAASPQLPETPFLRGTARPAGTSVAYELPESFLNSIAAARQEAQTLFEISHDLGNSLSLDETLSLLSVRLRTLVPYDSIAIFIRNEDELIARHVAGDHFRILSTLVTKVGQGLSGRVAESGTPVLNGPPALEFSLPSDRTRVAGLKSAVSVPLIGSAGTIGVLTLYRGGAEAFTRDHLRILLAISSKVAVSVENALRFQLAESSATTDYLTGLPNARSLFLHLDEEISRCKRESTSLAIMVCDLDGFKQINDQFGHLEGNKVLRLFAQLLRSASRNYDYVGRLGGDEFVIVAPGLKVDTARARAERLNESAMEAGMRICGQPSLSVSVGCAFLNDDGTDAEQLLAVADQRMYLEKQQHYDGTRKLIAFPAAQAQTGGV